MNKRLGFFGGCFNPPTIAHIRLAELAVEEVNLDKLYFVPMGNSYEKEGLIDVKHRINMLKLAIKNNPKLEVSEIQSYINKKMYAIDAFKLINKNFCESENFFIMGSDNFQKIEDWKKYNYIVFDRGNFKDDNAIIIKTSEKLKEISSSLIREKIKNNDEIDNLLIEDVEKYIVENKLYK